jgi:hypothetical protein
LLFRELIVFGAAEDRSGSVKGVEAVFGVLWKKPWRVFWFFMFWVPEVGFLRAGVEATGVEAKADGVPFAMLDFWGFVYDKPAGPSGWFELLNNFKKELGTRGEQSRNE